MKSYSKNPGHSREGEKSPAQIMNERAVNMQEVMPPELNLKAGDSHQHPFNGGETTKSTNRSGSVVTRWRPRESICRAVSSIRKALSTDCAPPRSVDKGWANA